MLRSVCSEKHQILMVQHCPRVDTSGTTLPCSSIRPLSFGARITQASPTCQSQTLSTGSVPLSISPFVHSISPFVHSMSPFDHSISPFDIYKRQFDLFLYYSM
uniref:Uncharacterized protein n=1 Tax=Knipowitschia caucasica TaxID=637954 RepID=A0AAV2JXX2_KNICA